MSRTTPNRTFISSDPASRVTRQASRARSRAGFTLIELIMIIILIAILASIAVPRFVNLSRQADIAATRGALGAIRAAMVMDYASRTLVSRGIPRFANVVYHSWFMELHVPTNELTNTSLLANAGWGAEDAAITGQTDQISIVENMDSTNAPSVANLNARGTASAASVLCCSATWTCPATNNPGTIAWVYESYGEFEGVVKACGDNSAATGYTDDQTDAW
ncbi:MAG: prepilin-type N-terminal cleavage/methylation domain-containing protein [Nitrospirae bacterium]|nr:prepilin-type N-terminal cleavage/methylation domain-containing protein [Nitrospirota bacterium]